MVLSTCPNTAFLRSFSVLAPVSHFDVKSWREDLHWCVQATYNWPLSGRLIFLLWKLQSTKTSCEAFVIKCKHFGKRPCSARVYTALRSGEQRWLHHRSAASTKCNTGNVLSTLFGWLMIIYYQCVKICSNHKHNRNIWSYMSSLKVQIGDTVVSLIGTDIADVWWIYIL